MALEQLGQATSVLRLKRSPYVKQVPWAPLIRSYRLILFDKRGMRVNEQKFQQQLMLQQARADAMTPRNQPMSGAGLFDPMAVGQQIYGSTPQY